MLFLEAKMPLTLEKGGRLRFGVPIPFFYKIKGRLMALMADFWRVVFYVVCV